MNTPQIRKLLQLVTCPPYTFVVVGNSPIDPAYLQVTARVPDSTTGNLSTQGGRKWRLNTHMTKSEIVQTALAAVLAFAEHEIRETFTYKGRAIFGPHFAVDSLVVLVDSSSPDARPAVNPGECHHG